MSMELMEIPEGILRRRLLVSVMNVVLIIWFIEILFLGGKSEYWLWFAPVGIVALACAYGYRYCGACRFDGIEVLSFLTDNSYE